ncbi:hypothetical protein GF389_04200 [Candidatus Dojkabacteria bacterium]|nr:hypothetical protein [Candidatus Dojkabacteria bacterium]
MNNDLITKIKILLNDYQQGKLGDTTMPEDAHPVFPDLEAKRIYYTLPMALNYQRNSYKLWESAKATWEDSDTNDAFSLQYCSDNSPDKLRPQLVKHKLALQPNKHIDTWYRIANTIKENWGSISKLIQENDSDYLKLLEILQRKLKG